MEKQLITLKNPYKTKYGIKLSRNERRRAEIELKIFEKEVEPLIAEFEDDLFKDFAEEIDYKWLYSEYLERVTKLCNWLNKQQFRVIQADNYFFYETYRPLETLKNAS